MEDEPPPPAQALPDQPEEPPELAPTKLAVSPGLRDWLLAHRTSIAFSTYQTGQLFLVGAHVNGSVSFNQQHFVRAMGLWWEPGRLHLAGNLMLWRLENMLRPGELANGAFDQAFVPRTACYTGGLDMHEIGIDAGGAPILVNTRFSCLATIDRTHSFRPLWRPPFISALAPEDRCHLNGLAMTDGRAAYVTAAGTSDVAGGWRATRADGGVLIDVGTGRTLLDGLSMPHSPRVAGDEVLLLEAGRGRILALARGGGGVREIARCPGFLRGLALHDGHAIVTVSKPRGGDFAGLPLDDALRERGETAWCGVLVVRLATGEIVEWIRLDGGITELFDVVAMPGVICPMSIGPLSQHMADTITIAE